MKEYVVGQNENALRVSRFVEKVTCKMPASLLHKSFRTGRIKINGKKAAPNTRLVPGDIVQLYLNDSLFPEVAETQAPPKPVFRLQTVWEDENLALLFKPAGVLCHSDNTGDFTLQEAFVAQLIRRGEFVPAAEHSFTPALCNRLDRGTEGLVLAAKNYTALREVNALLREGAIKKIYLCIVLGTPPQGTHTAYLCRDKAAKQATVQAHPLPGAKEIKTHIHVRQQKSGLALCEVRLLTGRTHQIRAHFAFLGAPLLGDKKYGNSHANRKYRLATQALCAWRLAFPDDLPENSPLAPLAGRSFTADGGHILNLWNSVTEKTAKTKKGLVDEI